MQTTELRPISRREFWDAVCELPPLIRFGYGDGPGAFLTVEPYALRHCRITGREAYTFDAFVVLKDEHGEARHYQHREVLTLHEFKALCDRVIPGVGLCSAGYGRHLINADPKGAERPQ